MGKFVHKPFFLHFQFHSSYLWLFCLTQSFLINHLSLHFNKTCFLPLEIFLIFLKRSGQRHSNFWLVWVRQEAYPGQCQSIYDFCWLPCMIGTLHHEKNKAPRIFALQICPLIIYHRNKENVTLAQILFSSCDIPLWQYLFEI